MKKVIAMLIAILCITSLLCVPVFAAETTASFSGPDTVRAGDTISVVLQVGGTGEYSITGTLSYDSNQLELKSKKLELGGDWVLEEGAGGIIMMYDNAMASPIKSSKKVLTLTFKVKDVAPGTKVTVSMNGITTSDGNRDTDPKNISYTTTIAQPLSSDNKLSGLTVSNATISPAFDPNTTSYTAEVPFEVSKLDVKATASDGKAKVTVDSPELTVNGTTIVTVTVKAENGSTKTYTITVKRAKDPNYVPSGENNLAGIVVEGFLLSPVFDPTVTEYVVWLPYETESVHITGAPVDTKASVRTEGGEALVAGQDNAVRVICTAENGTEKVYTVIAKRAAAHGETPTEPAPTEPPVTEPPATEPTVTEPAEPEAPVEPEASTGGIAWWWLLIVAVVCLGGGFASGFFGKDFLIKKKNS